jgi:hypothetical protein
MLIHPGFWSASKGMVLVPSIVNLSTSSATAAIIAAGLLNSGNTTETTGDSGLDGKVKTQDPVSGTKVQYETNVSYVSYTYVATPIIATPIIATPIIATPIIATPIIATPIIATPPPNRLCNSMNVQFGQCGLNECRTVGYGAIC